MNTRFQGLHDPAFWAAFPMDDPEFWTEYNNFLMSDENSEVSNDNQVESSDMASIPASMGAEAIPHI